MSAFFEISGLNIYIQIVVTIVSIAVHLFATRRKDRKEKLYACQSGLRCIAAVMGSFWVLPIWVILTAPEATSWGYVLVCVGVFSDYVALFFDEEWKELQLR